MNKRDLIFLGAGVLAGRAMRKQNSPGIGGLSKPVKDHYLEKFGDKMRGSSLRTAKDWVDGISTLSKAQKKTLHQAILRKYYFNK